MQTEKDLLCGVQIEKRNARAFKRTMAVVPLGLSHDFFCYHSNAIVALMIRTFNGYQLVLKPV